MSNKLTQFNEARLESIRNEVNAALRPIAEKYGLKGLRLGNCRFSPAEANYSAMKITLDAQDSDAAKKRMELLSRSLGFAESILGREMYANDGNKYRVIDINTRKRKYPIVGQNVVDTSKTMLFTENIRFIGDQPTKTILPIVNRRF